MAKKVLQTLKGFRDFLPEKMTIRNEVIKRLREVFEKYGFSELQTPSLEYQEILLGKYGKEAEKLMYLFEDPGGRKVGLRYDLTVPLARVASTYQALTKPFKRYQIQPVWRAEKPQKGRYREFYQCDVDTIGSTSPLADAEIIAITSDSLKALKFSNFKIRINSRAVLFSSMEAAGLAENKWKTAIVSIDKLNKKSKAEVEEELASKGLKFEQIKALFNSIKKARPDNFLNQVISYAQKLGAAGIEFDSALARGLDYYTGPIFESVVDKPKIGSVTGGGRYDKLLKSLGGPDLPAVGTTIGLDRVADVIEELNLWPNLTKTPAKVLVTIFSPKELNASLEVVKLIRNQGINAEIYPDENTRLNKQLKYADKKQIPYTVIIGPEETKEKKVLIKEMETGKQKRVDLKDLAVHINH